MQFWDIWVDFYVCSGGIQGGSQQHSRWCASLQLKSSWQCPALIISFSIRAVRTRLRARYVQSAKLQQWHLIGQTCLKVCVSVFFSVHFSGLPNVFFSFQPNVKVCMVLLFHQGKKLHLKSNSWWFWLKNDWLLVSLIRHGVIGSLVLDFNIFTWSQH